VGLPETKEKKKKRKEKRRGRPSGGVIDGLGLVVFSCQRKKGGRGKKKGARH